MIGPTKALPRAVVFDFDKTLYPQRFSPGSKRRLLLPGPS